MNKVYTFFFLFFYLLGYGQMGPCSIEGGFEEQELYFRIDNIPDDFDIGEVGEGNLWTTNLKSPRTNTYRYVKASNGIHASSFPDAEMVLREPFGKEKYFMKVNETNWYEIGFASLAKNSIEPIVRNYSVPITACVPTKYGTIKKFQTSYEENGQEITSIYTDIKDATGVLYLEDGFYDAYRVKRIQSWTSNESFPVTSYIFVDQITNIFLMEAFVDENERVTKVIYKANKASNTRVRDLERNNFLLYPNTGYGEVRLEFSSFDPDNYQLHVFDLVGRKLWSKTYRIEGDVTVKEDLSFLPRGTYTYTIVDSDKNKIVTRRLAIIKS